MEFSIESLSSIKVFYRRRYGIALDDPNKVNPERCRYDVAVESDISLPNMKTRKLDAGEYAIFQIDHTKEAILSFWNIFSSLLNKGSYIIDESRPILERYKVHLINERQCEMLVPIII